MYCEQPPPKPEKPICRCKNCILRPEGIVPWTNLMAAAPTDHEAAARARQSVDSVYTIADGEDTHNRNYQYDKRDSQMTKSSWGNYSPEHHSPVRKGGNSPVHASNHHHATHPSAPQPTILLIVVNKPEPPSFPGRGHRASVPEYPGSGPGYPGSGPGYPGSGPGYPGSGPGYPGSGPGYPGSGQRYSGQAPRGYGYPSPGRRRWSGPGPGAPNGYYNPSPGSGPRRRPGYEDRFRNGGYRNYQNDSRYPEDWRQKSRGYPNNGYADPPRNRSTPEKQRNCRCPEKGSRSSREIQEEALNTPSLNEDRLQGSGNRGVDNRLGGSGNPNPCTYCTRQRRADESEGSDFSINQETPSTQDSIEEQTFQEPLQKVVVTDDKNKTFKCIQVPICISVGKPDCCPCCKCAQVPTPTWDSDSETISVKANNDEDEECTCNPQIPKCNCGFEPTYPGEFATECNLTNLEQTLRNLIPNADCMCYLKKKKRRRRRRRKWSPKVVYDRFANPPFVLNPKPRCLEYGRSPCCNSCCNPCYNPCCCAPVGKSCYRCDYCCGC